MNRHDALERELTVWFSATAMPRTPDYTTDIVQLTATVRQRPRWAFPERWLPVSVVLLRRRSVAPVPVRAVGLLVVLALLVAAVAFYVGTRPRLPAPYGPAANGLVVYAKDGDILTVDPVSGEHRAVMTGSDIDREPRWSLDGTRIAFLRKSGLSNVLVIYDHQRRAIVATTVPLQDIDTDTIGWSPDGRSITLAAGRPGSPGSPGSLYLVDAGDGGLTPLDIPYAGLDVHWRPPDGRQILFLGGIEPDVGLYLVDVDDPTVVSEVVRLTEPGALLRPGGFTPDGRSVIYTTITGEDESQQIRSHVVDLATGNEVVIEAMFPHVSNDGTRLLAIDRHGWPCVASIEGGRCEVIADSSQAYGGMHDAGARWAPNDEWILVRIPSVEEGAYRATILDPAGGPAARPAWVVDGAESVQRLAP
jgi:Tol biopolymer transport system component